MISEHFGHEPAPASLHPELDGAEIHLCTNSVNLLLLVLWLLRFTSQPLLSKVSGAVSLSTWLLSSPPASGQRSVYQLADPLLMPAWALPNGGP